MPLPVFAWPAIMKGGPARADKKMKGGVWMPDQDETPGKQFLKASEDLLNASISLQGLCES